MMAPRLTTSFGYSYLQDPSVPMRKKLALLPLDLNTISGIITSGNYNGWRHDRINFQCLRRQMNSIESFLLALVVFLGALGMFLIIFDRDDKEKSSRYE